MTNVFYDMNLAEQVRVLVELAHPGKPRDPDRRGDSLMREVAATTYSLCYPLRYMGETLMEWGTRHHLFEVYDYDAERSPATTRVHVEESVADHDTATTFRITLMSTPTDDAEANTRYFDRYDHALMVMLTLGALACDAPSTPVTWARIDAELKPLPLVRETGKRAAIAPWRDDEFPEESMYVGPAEGCWQ
ncbi:hypothetical protein [Corynebacterium sp. c24Ua_83]|uniref:hypothetical protein n=1 Tax=Corynebacterium sp. c24Ua_83 TaxID=3032350 RepID=UPI0032642486